jgi:LAO/AO transport system kinase
MSEDPSVGRRDPAALLSQAAAGDRVALSRLLSLVEQQSEATDAVERLIIGQRPPMVLGITGAPGAGKSTLTDQLIGSFRSQGVTVAVVAIDPSSPFTGGAILGDRIRMTDHAGDDGVFVRSLATRGAAGGLAVAVPGSLRLLGAAGFEVAIIETVGVGQIELDIAHACDCVVVVVNPGWGDEVQAVKAGVLEIADVFVVNKADLPGAAQTESDLRAASSISASPQLGVHTAVGVVQTVATTGVGIAELHRLVVRHGTWLDQSGLRTERRRRQIEHELAARVQAAFAHAAGTRLCGSEADYLLHLVEAGDLTVSDAAGRLVPKNLLDQVTDR